MAVDKNPRHWFIDATDIAANVDADQIDDYVTIEFAGRVTPTTKQRIKEALIDGNFEITEKKLA